MKTAISIPDHVFALAELYAKDRNMTRSSLFAVAIDEYIHRHREDGVSSRLNEVYGSEESSVDPVLSRLQSESVLDGEW